MTLENKQILLIPCLYDCPLKLGSRLIISYLMYRDKYSDDPSDRKIHLHTGLARQTISDIRNQLVHDGWWDDGKPTPQLLSHTRPADNKVGYQYFKSYVHKPGSLQSFGAISCWSLMWGYYLLWKQNKANKLPAFSFTYFEDVLGMGNGSGKNCMDSLVKGGFIKYSHDGKRMKIDFRDPLGPMQLNQLADNVEFVDNSEDAAEFGSFTDDEVVAINSEIVYNDNITNKEVLESVNNLIKHMDIKFNEYPFWQRNKAAFTKRVSGFGSIVTERDYPAYCNQIFDAIHKTVNGVAESLG